MRNRLKAEKENEKRTDAVECARDALRVEHERRVVGELRECEAGKDENQQYGKHKDNERTRHLKRDLIIECDESCHSQHNQKRDEVKRGAARRR